MTIRNPGGGRTPLLMAEEQLDYALGDRPRFVLPSMLAGERREVSYLIRCHTRGQHRLGPLGLRVRDPFGLTSRDRCDTQGHGTIVVLPRIHPLGAAAVARARASGPRARSRTWSGSTVRTTRPSASTATATTSAGSTGR